MKVDWNPEHPNQALILMNDEDFKEKFPDLYAKTAFRRAPALLNYCQAYMYQNIISGVFIIPKKQHPIKDHIRFGFVLDHDSLYFIYDGQNQITEMIRSFCAQYDSDFTDPLLFLLEFMLYMIGEDMYFLEDYNDKLEEIEEKLYRGKSSSMERFTIETRRDMNILSNYYLQLTAVGDAFQEAMTSCDRHGKLPKVLIQLYNSRIDQLSGMTSDIKAHTTQIWNLKQTQLSDRQNKISTLLTIITVIFLPLTMITGWFGMNFTSMDLLHKPWGYHFIIIVCIVIVAGEIIFLLLNPDIRAIFSRSTDNLIADHESFGRKVGKEDDMLSAASGSLDPEDALRDEKGSAEKKLRKKAKDGRENTKEKEFPLPPSSCELPSCEETRETEQNPNLPNIKEKQ